VADLLAIAAGRCGVMQGDIQAAAWWCQRVPNGATEYRVKLELAKLGPAARKLVGMVLRKRDEGRQAC
jgi:hypothetical protein